jgi:hypothetical protein
MATDDDKANGGRAGFAPRQLTQDPRVAAEYANWIPYYAPGITFPKITSPTPYVVVDVAAQVPIIREEKTPYVVTNPATMVPRYNNAF